MSMNQSVFIKLSTRFIVTLIIMFLGKTSLWAGEDKKLIVLVSVKYENLHRDYYKHETSQSNWEIAGNKQLAEFINHNFGTSKYSTSIVKPGKCYIIYSKQFSNGKINHYSQTHHGNIDSAHSAAKKKDIAGYKTLDVGCNDGIPPNIRVATAQQTLEFADFINDIFNDNPSQSQYRCSKNSAQTFSIIKHLKPEQTNSKSRKNTYILRSDKNSRGIINTVKLTQLQLVANSATNKDKIPQYFNDVTNAIESVCSSGSEAAMQIFGKVKQAFILKMQARAKKCKENKENDKKCKTILRHSVYASMSIRG